MPWRYFYSTEESDTALKAILDASKFSKDYSKWDGLTEGVYEYRIFIEQDSEFLLLQKKIDDQKIRALASPERLTQFGNIKPDNYFDTTKYASGCSYRDTDTLAHMIVFLSAMKTGNTIAQRDLDIQGTASLGTVALTLSSLYKKTYNVPVNGSVSDRTLVKATIDSTAPAVTETNAATNQAMFDFQDPHGVSYSVSGTPDSGTITEFQEKLQDRKVSLVSTAYFYAGGGGQTKYFVCDFGAIATRNIAFIYDTITTDANQTMRFKISNDGVAYTQIDSFLAPSGTTTYSKKTYSDKTFRYLRVEAISAAAGNIKLYGRELFCY